MSHARNEALFSFIKFNPEWSGWSAFTFWIVLVSILLTLAFTVVVFFCGLSDLRFLLRALDEERVDETDDGRVSDDGPRA
jgi:hypothetical protein